MTDKKIIQIINNIDASVLKSLNEDYQIEDTIEDPDAIIVRSADLHDHTFSEDLLFIGRAGAGTNNIPTDRCSQQGIVVANAPGSNANGVKEMVILAMILASRQVFEAVEWTQNLKGQDNIEEKVEAGKKQFVGGELRGKVAGVIGLGSIGGRVANMLVDFGMEVYGYDPYVTLRSAWGVDSRVHYSKDLETLFRECDYVTIHVPMTNETKNLINQQQFALAKKGLILINMARDGLVNLADLEKAIHEGIVAKYVVDFPEAATLNMPNTINIPHLGASTPESQTNAARMVVNQMVDYLENGNITNSVNFPDVNNGVCQSVARLTLLHKNRPNMINEILDFLGEAHINIATLNNNHRGEWAYTMIDVDSPISDTILQQIQKINDIVRVRLIEGRGA